MGFTMPKQIKDHLSNILWLANRRGAKLRSRRHKKYPYIVYGTDEFGRTVKMGGTRDWMADQIIESSNNYIEWRIKNESKREKYGK